MAIKTLDNAPLPDAPTTKEAKDVTAEKDYWNDFYARFSISHPSQFCVMAAIECEREIPIVKFGCGNGRDSIYLATHGYTVYGCDLSVSAIEKNIEKLKTIKGIEFKVVDAVDGCQQHKFFEVLSSALVEGDKVYFEFHSKMDESLDKVHGKEHYHRYVNTPVMMKDLSELGFDVMYEITGRGMAKYKQEDPYISRVIARKA